MPIKKEYQPIYDKFYEQLSTPTAAEKTFLKWATKKGIDPYEIMPIESKSLTFTTDQLSISTKSELGEEKEHYITGYISTSDLDGVNDIVTGKCLDDMTKQINSGNVKLDIEHEAYKNDPTTIPIGKITQAVRDTKGILIKAVLNRYTPRFKEIWHSLKSGFLDAFSITFRTIPSGFSKKTVNGVETRLLNKVDLLNVALTGNPCNKHAKIKEVFAKSLSTQEVNKMTKKELKEDEPVVEPVAEPAKDEPAPTAPAEDAPKEDTEAKDVEVVESKSMSDLLTEVKSLGEKVTSLEEQLDQKGKLSEEIKSLTEKVATVEAKMKKPVFKAVPADLPTKEQEAKALKTQDGFLSKI